MTGPAETAVDWAGRLCGIGDEAAPGIDAQIGAHTALGWRHLELRSVDGTAVGDLPADRAGEIARRIAAAGLSVPCIDSRIGNWARPITFPFERELAELDAVTGLAARLGTRYVRVMSYPNDGLVEADWARRVVRRLRLLAERAADRGVLLVHENCAGWAATSGERAVALVGDVGSDRLRLLFDVGNPVAHGYDGTAYLAAVLPWVEHVHVKDALPAGECGAGVVFTAPGHGVARLADCLAALRRAGYRGLLSIEPHVAVLPHAGRRGTPEDTLASYLGYARALTGWLEQRQPAGPAPEAAR